MNGFGEKPEKPKGVEAKKPEKNAGQEGAKVELSPRTTVRIVKGSNLYHADMKCSTLAEEQNQFKDRGIGYLYGQMPGKEKLSLCPDCDAGRFTIMPRNPYVGI